MFDLSEEAGTKQINTLIYSMDPRAADILASFKLNAIEAKEYDVV